VAQRKSKDCNHQHQTCGHELFGFPDANCKDDNQQGQQDVRHVILEYDASSAKAQRSCKRCRHDQRDFTFRLEVTNQSSDHQNYYVNPQNLVWMQIHFRADCTCGGGRWIQRIFTLPLHLDIQYLARFAFSKDFKWAATYFAIGRKPLRRKACVNYKFETLAAERAVNQFANFHMTSLCDFRR
jgi:hypothetical protein